MNIILITFGSRGDVQPLLSLSLTLKDAGHNVLLAAPPEKAKWVSGLGCPFHPFGNNITAFLDQMNEAYSFRAAIKFVEYLHEAVLSQFDVLPEIISGADLVIGSSLAFALSTVAESLSIPYRYIAFTPQLFPSGHHPFFALKHHGLPAWYNRVTWSFALYLDQFNMTKHMNMKRKKVGLKPVQDVWFHILGKNPILACDRVIAEIPSDVRLPITQTGYMHLNQPVQYNSELKEFLEAGSPPVYAGFGSMPKHDQARCIPLIVNATRSNGKRVIISKFWDDPNEYEGSNDVFFIGKFPHLMLFPYMSVIVHHGGAGTTATSVLSGIPQIIIPHVLDQFYWGYRVYCSGLGPKPIWRSRLTSKKLAKAIRKCLTDEHIRHKAKEASKMIDPQESIEKTVNEVLKVSKV
jgi:UDP:flavonoid glycosyltransferase YjiC (YdhE family)